MSQEGRQKYKKCCKEFVNKTSGVLFLDKAVSSTSNLALGNFSLTIFLEVASCFDRCSYFDKHHYLELFVIVTFGSSCGCNWITTNVSTSFQQQLKHLTGHGCEVSIFAVLVPWHFLWLLILAYTPTSLLLLLYIWNSPHLQNCQKRIMNIFWM
jgi:hypothetical protein